MVTTPLFADSSLDTLETSARAGRGDLAARKQGAEEIKRRRAEARADRQATEHFRAKGYDLTGYELPPSTPAEEAFRHSGWAATRRRLRESLERTGATAKTLEAWDCCGSAAYVLQHKETGAVRLAANHCHHRLCLPCQAARSRLISGNVRKALTARHYLHVVLTLAHTDAPLSDQITRLYKAFKKLRGRPIWKNHTAGGAAFLEVTRNDQARQWHVHLHVITEGRFIPHKDQVQTRKGKERVIPGLSSTWLQVTGDSSVCWLRPVTDRDDAAREVAKYVTKPLSPAALNDPDALDELVIALRGRRLCLTFGSWYKIRLSERPNKYDPAEWETLGSLDDFIARAEGGELIALDILRICYEVLPCRKRPPPLVGLLFPLSGRPPAPSAASI